MLRALTGGSCFPRAMWSSDLTLRHQHEGRASPGSCSLGTGTLSTGLAETGFSMEGSDGQWQCRQ